MYVEVAENEDMDIIRKKIVIDWNSVTAWHMDTSTEACES